MSRKATSLELVTTQLRKLPARLPRARKALKGWSSRATRMTKESPGRSLLGAFAIGFVFAKLARFV